jgi:hypothetical protein
MLARIVALLSVVACRPSTAAPVCPTCPTCPPPAAAAAPVVAPPVAHAPTEAEAPDEADVAPALSNTNLAMIVAEAHESEDEVDESEDPPVHLHIRIAPRGGGVAKVLERSSPPVPCLSVQPQIEVIHSDEEIEIVDVRVVCMFGEETIHEDIEHTIVRIATSGTDVEAKIVFTGQSTVTENRRLEVVADRLDFHVEAGALAVYRHRVAWCDREGMKTLMGEDFAGCAKTRKRTLTLVKRIPLD